MAEIILDNLIICLILAIDVFLIGFNYGVSKIKVPFVSIVSITLINFIVIGFGVVISYFCSGFISEKVLEYISIGLLFILGVFNLIKVLKNCNKDENLDKNNDKILSPYECLFLALILTPDGFSASLGCGGDKVNCVTFIIIFVITTFFAIFISTVLGYKLSRKIKLNLKWLSPVFLIFYSIFKLVLTFI